MLSTAWLTQHRRHQVVEFRQQAVIVERQPDACDQGAGGIRSSNQVRSGHRRPDGERRQAGAGAAVVAGLLVA
jgi:hypothetical protein